MDASARRHAIVLAIAAGVLLAQQTAAKTARDALFLASQGSEGLPRVMVASAVLSFVVVLVMAKLIAKLGPWVVLTSSLLLNGAFFVAEGALSPGAPWIPFALYLHLAALGSVLVSAFWSVVTERFDPFTARQVMGRIGAGATLGGAIGGALADGVNRVVGARGLLYVLAGTSLVAAALVMQVRTGSNERIDGPATSDSPFAAFREAPYLVGLAALSLLGALWSGLVDFGMKSDIARTLEGPDQLVSFFGWFYTIVGVATFVVQTTLGGRLLKRYGIDVVVAILPVVVGSMGLITGALASTWLLVALRGTEAMLANSVHRSSYELFFTPLPNAIKRPTKTIVDVAATRLGDAVAGGLMLVLFSVLPSASLRIPVFVAALAAIVAFALVATLHRGYVDALTRALRTGPMDLGPSEDLDALTHRTLAGSNTGVDREALLREIEEYRKEHAGPSSRAMPRTPTISTTLSTTSLEARIANTLDPRVSLALLFLSSDEARIKRNLARGITTFTVPFVLPLLKRKNVAEDAEKALLALGPRVLGALGDALLDPAEPRRVRVRLAAMLGTLGERRAKDTLLVGLEDTDAAIRLASARALSALTAAHPALTPPAAEVLELVAAALERDGASPPLGSLPPRAEDAADDPLARVDPRLHVPLTLLALVLDREALEMSIRALGAADVSLRGTAFEYLENVVAEPARTPLLRQLTKGPSQRRRSERELLDELRRTKG